MSTETGTQGKRGPYRTYTDQERSIAMTALQATGSAELAAITAGVPRKTVESWRDNPRVTSVLSRNADIRLKSEQVIESGLLKVIRKGLKHLDRQDVWDKAGVKDAAIATGIAHTHLRLLRSQPTSISETRDLASFLSTAYGERTNVVDVTPVEALPAKGGSTTRKRKSR